MVDDSIDRFYERISTELSTKLKAEVGQKLDIFHLESGNSNENYKVNDLNVQADASGDDEDDIDWEEG
uniref:Uncharacterized protein n=1 Tax=Quercus lobata TaxID=97700 RepID=A0A7N2MQE6_QUELO